MPRRRLAATLGPALVIILAAAASLLLIFRRAPSAVTFFVTSDTHYGADPSVEEADRRTIDVMNGLPGTTFPGTIGGKVAQPRGVAVLGDLVNDGEGPDASKAWKAFTRDFGVAGEGRLRFPVYENAGNHDGGESRVVRRGVRERNKVRPGAANVSANGVNYSWDWDGIHFVSLGLFAGSAGDDIVNPWGRKFDGAWKFPGHSLEFLREDLSSRVGRSGRPVILFQHYGWDIWGLGWWSEGERKALADVIKGYNVIAIFWGHTHQVQYVPLNGIPTFCAGAGQAGPAPGSFLVVRITAKELAVAERKGPEWGYAARFPLGKARR